MRGVIAAAAALAALAAWPAAAVGSQAACLTGPQAAVLVSYTRTGGFVGVNDRLTVYRSGRARLARRTGPAVALTLTCSRLRVLRDRLVRARFASLQPVYLPDTPVADGWEERVRFRGRTVRVHTGAVVPLRLRRVLDPLRDFVANRA
jgi:hypothetical protein